MKQIHVILAVMLCFFQLHLFAQYLPKSILPYQINICPDKTSNLIFPVAIKSVDRGSQAVLAQKATGVENILQVKAADKDFTPTNLTVITAEGHFYSFAVSYALSPAILNFSFVSDSSEKAIIKDQSLAEASFTSTANAIKSNRHSIHKSIREQDIKVTLSNLFIKDDLLLVEISINNQSLVPFLPEYARFFIQDMKTAKRSATQQIELLPLQHTALDKVNGHTSQTYVFSFTPFTVPRTKELIIQMGENKGSRLLTLHVNHRINRKIKEWKEERITNQ